VAAILCSVHAGSTKSAEGQPFAIWLLYVFKPPKNYVKIVFFFVF